MNAILDCAHIHAEMGRRHDARAEEEAEAEGAGGEIDRSCLI